MIAGNSQATFDYATGPGTVEYALSRPDGARVSLTMVVIGRIDTSQRHGISVHEWWDKTTSVTVLFDPTLGLKTGQTIDIEGRMTTLPSRSRAVVCERIALYLDRFGYVTDSVPPLKGLFEPSVWPSRGWIPVRQSAFAGMSALTITPLDDPGPPVGAEPPEYELDFVPGTIPWAKSLKDGDPVALIGQIVTASRGQVDDCIYIEERHRSSGIRVVTGSPVAVGDVVELTSGVMGTTSNGERLITASEVRPLCTGSLQPSGITNRDLGGYHFAYNSVTGAGQQSVVGGVGLNNIGSLVKVWGKVTCDGGDYVYIDDGSALQDGTLTSQVANVGVRVVAGTGATLPEFESIVELTGISSCMIPQGEEDPIRLLRIPTPVMHVKTDGNDGDGLSWENAKSTVGAAIQAAVAGQEIWVAEGIYPECITIDKELRLFGGFAGDESYRDERDWHENVTTLDADGAGRVVSCPEESAESVVDGFIIQHGTALNGGGISCIESSPTISHNIITANTAECGSECTSRGGGIYCVGGSPLIIGNVIKSDVVSAVGGLSTGGGIYCESCPSIRIVNNTIAGNTCGNDGGGIYLSDGWPVVANNIIASNSSGVYVAAAAPQLLNNCVHNPLGDDYSGVSAGPNDILDDPLLNTDAIHLLSGSPCIGGGEAENALESLDIDHDCRVMGGAIDIGADEADGCVWLDLAVTAAPVPVGIEASVTAFVFDRTSGDPVASHQVSFSAVDGSIVDPEGGVGLTESDGRAKALVDRPTAGYTTVTVSISTCSGQLTKTIRVFFYDSQDGWPMFMHDPQHTGASLAFDMSQADSLTLTWSASVPAVPADRQHWSQHPNPQDNSVIFGHPYINASPVHAPGCPVIVGAWASGNYSSSTGYVVAFDPDAAGPNGVQVWRYPATGTIGGVASTPAIFSVGADKRVVFGSMDGKVYCLNAVSGALIWSYQTLNRAEAGNGKILASPTVCEGRVYIGNESSRMYCLDAETTNSSGDLEWSYDLPPYSGYNDGTGLSSAAIGMVDSEARLYVGSDNGRLYCLSTADNPANRIVWTYPDPQAPDPLDDPLGCIESSPSVYNGMVYAGTSWYQGTALVAVNADAGDLVWSTTPDRSFYHEVRCTPAILNGRLFAGEDTGSLLYGIDAATGKNSPIQYPPNPFDAAANVPEQGGSNSYFVGSAALTTAGYGFVGNDNFALYTLSSPDLSLLSTFGSGGVVCSSPAISYAAEPLCRWTYVLSRGDNGRGDGKGTLFAFRRTLN